MAKEEEYKDLTEKKLTTKIPAWLLDRLKNNKQFAMKDFVSKALENEFKKVDAFDWMKITIPELMQRAIMDSEMGNILTTMASDIKPAIEMMELSSIEMNSRVMLETMSKKFNLLYRVASDQEIPKDVVSLQLIQELIDDGYLVQLSDSSFDVTKHRKP